MRLVFMGTPDYAIPVLEAILSPDAPMDTQVVGVYTQPDKPKGRGRASDPTPVKSFALERGLDVYQPASLRRSEVGEELASLRPDAIVVAAYGKFLPTNVLSIPPHGCLNVHPSLLPRYRGPSPVATAILEGETSTGTTIILLDEGMDSGPILAGREADIGPEATTQGLTPQLFQIGGELLKEVLPPWTRGEIPPQPQDESKATFTKMLEREDGEAHWELPAEELERRLRAFTPWPGLFTHWKGRLVKILSATAINDSGGGTPGLIVPVEEPGIAAGVVTGRGILGISGIQMEGKRPTWSREFVQGYKDFAGSTLPS